MLIVTFLFFTSSCTAPKNQIFGTWKLVSGKHNGAEAPQFLSNRFQSFNTNRTFESHVKTDKGWFQANGGVFYLINDTTMITYHQNLLKKLDNTANTYNFRINNDSLHFYGFYLRQLPQNPSMLLKVYIEEWWVRTGKK